MISAIPQNPYYNGLLGLAKEIKEQYTSKNLLLVDYNEPLERVYLELVRFLVLYTGKLDALRFYDSLGRMPGLHWPPT